MRVVRDMVGFSPLAWWRDARRMRTMLRACSLSASNTSANQGELLVVLMPWLGTALPWFSLALGMLLAGRGSVVRYVVDDMPFDPHWARSRFIVAVIRWVLRAVSNPGAVQYLSRHRGKDGGEAALRRDVQELAELNAVWALKGETYVTGRQAYVRRAERRLMASYAAIGNLLAAQPLQAIVVPGGVYGSSGIWMRCARSRSIRTASFDSGGAGILTVAADGVACQLADIPRAFAMLKGRCIASDEHKLIFDSALAELARRRAGTDKFASQVAMATGAEPRFAGAVLVALNSAWDSAALGLHVVFSSSVEWMLETCRHLLEQTTVEVIVRQHPAERSIRARSRDDYASILHREFGNQARLHFIAAGESVNTYDLLASVTAVVVHTSTVGLEAASAGKHVFLEKPIALELAQADELVALARRNGLKFTITQDMQWVSQSSTTSACDSGGTGSNSILQVSESVTWPGAGATAPANGLYLESVEY